MDKGDERVVGIGGEMKRGNMERIWRKREEVEGIERDLER